MRKREGTWQHGDAWALPGEASRRRYWLRQCQQGCFLLTVAGRRGQGSAGTTRRCHVGLHRAVTGRDVSAGRRILPAEVRAWHCAVLSTWVLTVLTLGTL